MIANPIGYMSILNDAEQIIRDRKVKVLSSEIFKLPRFDFNEYIESNVNLKAMISNFDILSKYEVETINIKNTMNSLCNLSYLKFLQEAQKCSDYEVLKNDLLNFLNQESINTVNCILEKIKLVCNSSIKVNSNFYKYHNYFSPYTKNEQNKITKIDDYINRNLKHNSDDLWEYEQYRLLEPTVEVSNLYFKCGVDAVEEMSYTKDKCAIDAGACIGDTSMILQDYTHCSKVIAFEPDPIAFEKLIKTMKVNGRKNIVLENLGLGNANNTMKFYMYGDGVSTFSKERNNMAKDISRNVVKIIDVDVVTLDNYVKQNNLQVGIIKTDLEGFEPQFLEGAKETIKNQKPILLISIYHNFHDFFKIKTWIENLKCGYKFKINKPIYGSILGETKLIAEPILS